MVKSVEIPQDIIYSVIAAVGDDTRLLEKCALVSYSFLLPSRKKLFSRITLKNERTCQGIYQFLVQNPVVQSFVRSIYLTDMEFDNSEWMNDTSGSLLAILRLPFRCLECFSFDLRERYPRAWNHDPRSWDAFSSELKDVLSNILHLSTLKTLSLKGVTKVPITFFLQIVHLTTLELCSLSPNDFGDENSSSLTLAASNGVVPVASHTVIDRCLWYIAEPEKELFKEEGGTKFPSSAYFSLIQDMEGPTKSIFLPFMCRLRFFEIRAHLSSGSIHDFNTLPLITGSLCMSLTSPATLEHLLFNIWLYDDDDHIVVHKDEIYHDLRCAKAWSYLDSITTLPTGSQLQRVDINIHLDCDFYENFHHDIEEDPIPYEVKKAVLDGLPLLRAKDILCVNVIVVR